MSKLRIIKEPVAEGYGARGTSSEFMSASSFTAALTSLAGLPYVLVALACGTLFTLLGSLLFYETLRFSAMLLHMAL